MIPHNSNVSVIWLGERGLFKENLMMSIFKAFLWVGLSHLAIAGHGAWAQNDAVSPGEKSAFMTVEWADLIPPEVLESLLNK